jgi:hypothetical protein
VDAELDDIVFKDAQKDKLVKDIYQEIVNLKRDFETMIDSVQEKNKLRNQVNEVQ